MANALKAGERYCPKCKEAIKVDASICKHCRTEFSADEVAAAVKASKRRTKIAGFGCLGLILLMGSCVAIMGGDKEPSKTVRGAAPEIAEVQAYPETKHASVKVNLEQSWSDSDLPVQAAMTIEDIGKSMKAGAQDIPADMKTVSVWFTAPTIDAYGKTDRMRVLELQYDTADLKKVQYENVSSQALLELATDVDMGGPAGRSAVDNYCAGHQANNPRFCAKIMR